MRESNICFNDICLTLFQAFPGFFNFIEALSDNIADINTKKNR